MFTEHQRKFFPQSLNIFLAKYIMNILIQP
jgi:hypothetical protein